MVNVIGVSLLVLVVVTIIVELYYYGKPDFFTKAFAVIVTCFSLMYVTGFGDYIINQLEVDMKTTTYYPVVNMSEY